MTQYTDEKLTEVNAKILAAMASGTMPWRKEWRTLGATGQPHNAITGRAYRGCNWFLLSCAAYSHGGWLTYEQARKAGGSVRKGQKGTSIIFWKPTKYAVTDAATGEERTRGSLIMKFYSVFNVEQCEGLKLPARETVTAPLAIDCDMERVYGALGANVTHGGDSACYIPSADAIRLPVAGAFTTLDAYKATAFHELGHWTGHSTRLDRLEGMQGRFGSQSYAAEELVAELCAAYCCAVAGVNSSLENHASYLSHWQKIIADDPKAIITASSKAQAAFDFIAKGAGLVADESEDDEAQAA